MSSLMREVTLSGGGLLIEFMVDLCLSGCNILTKTHFLIIVFFLPRPQILGISGLVSRLLQQ